MVVPIPKCRSLPLCRYVSGPLDTRAYSENPNKLIFFTHFISLPNILLFQDLEEFPVDAMEVYFGNLKSSTGTYFCVTATPVSDEAPAPLFLDRYSVLKLGDLSDLV